MLDPVARETGDEEPAGGAALPAERQGQRGPGSRVLVLNASYEPINVCTVRRAAVLLLKNRAEMLEHADWSLHAESLTLPRPVVLTRCPGRSAGSAPRPAGSTSAGPPMVAVAVLVAKPKPV